jgi:hypothetical protein
MARTVEELLAEQNALLRKQANSGSTANLDVKTLNERFSSVGQEAVKLTKSFADGALSSLETFQRLSSSGSSFSGDLIGMTKSAANSRLSLDQFSDLIKENGSRISGLGGNVTRGAEAFAKLSKEFFDSGAANELRNIGYTSKDLNEILALQASTQRAGYKDTEEGRRKSYMAAKELAEQMDAVAKLTGKSREQQMEEMKKANVDGQVTSKIRLLANGDLEKEALLRSEYNKLALEARKRGDEELFKQQFAAGTYLTQAAGTQASVLGKQSRAVEEAAARLAKGDVSGARAASERADAEAVKNGRDRTILLMGTMGEAGGAVSGVAKKFVENTETFNDNVMRVAAANGILLRTQEDYAKALKLTMDDIKQAQKGNRQEIDPKTGKPTGEYKDVGQSGRAAVAVQAAGQDIKSAAATAAATAVTQKTLDKLAELADLYYKQGMATKLENQAISGVKNKDVTTTVGPDGQPRDPVSAAQLRREQGGAVGAATQALSSITDFTVSAITGTANFFLDGKAVPGKSTGSIGTVGKIMEDFGAGTLAVLHGREGVITEDQMANLAKGIQGQSASAVIGTLKNSLPKPGSEDKSFAEGMAESIRKGMQTVGVNPNMRGNPTGGMDGFDLSSISKDIATSFSSVSGGGSTTTQRNQSAESSSAEQEMAALTKKFRDDFDARKKILIEGMAVEDRKYSNVQKAMKADEVAVKLKEEYQAKQAEIQKKIDAGITYETTKKEEQLAVTKKLSTEELAAKNAGRKTFDPNINDGGKAHREGEREYAQQFAAEGNLRTIDKLNADFDKALGIKSPAGSATAASTEGKTSTPRLPAMDLNAINLPGFGPGIKAKAANVVAPKPESQPAADTKKPAAAPGSAKPQSSTSGKESTLNDVVASLNTLNTKMGQLIAQNEELGAAQIKATKTAGSSNLFKA